MLRFASNLRAALSVAATLLCLASLSDMPNMTARFRSADVIRIFEFATLAIIAGLALWSVRPLLEEWSNFVAFERSGLLVIAADIAPSPAQRPLHAVSYYLQWVAAGGHPVGVGIVAALLVVARYFAIRWATAPVLPPRERWLAATLGAVLLAWPGTWLGRFGAAQLAALLFFVALGFAIRLVHRGSAIRTMAGTLCIFVSLTIYQGLAVLMIVAPLCATLLARAANPSAARSSGDWLRPAVPFLLGLGLYAAFFVIVGSTGEGRTYEGEVMAGVSLSLATLWHKIRLVYWSAFGQTGFLLGLFLASALVLQGARFRPHPGEDDLARMLGVLLAILALPLLALVYISDLHARDPERVLFPVSTGFCLVMMFVLKPGQERLRRAGLPAVGALVLTALVVSASLALDVRRYWAIQNDVIAQVLPLATDAPPAGLVIRDHSGVLGDVYTFLAFPGNQNTGSALQLALAHYGADLLVRICTPPDVDRLHEVARRYPIPTTERCNVVPAVGSLALEAHAVDGRILIER